MWGFEEELTAIADGADKSSEERDEPEGCALASGGAAGSRNTVETFCGLSGACGGSVNGMDKVEDVECGTSRSVEEDVEDGGKPVEDVEDVADEGTTVPAREVVPRCAAFSRAADDLQISCNSSK